MSVDGEKLEINRSVVDAMKKEADDLYLRLQAAKAAKEQTKESFEAQAASIAWYASTKRLEAAQLLWENHIQQTSVVAQRDPVEEI